MVSKFASALASVTLVPLPPKSQSTTTPFGGSPGADCNAESAAIGIGDQRGDLAAGRQARRGAQRATQRTDGRSAPMCGHRDRDGCTSANGAGHRVESFDKHLLAAVR